LRFLASCANLVYVTKPKKIVRLGRPPIEGPSRILYLRIHGRVLELLERAEKRGRGTGPEVVRRLILEHLR